MRTYTTNGEDYELFETRFWDKLSEDERQKAKHALHLLPTRASVDECNIRQLAALAKPVVKCKAKHNCPAAKKASDEDADGLQTEVLLAEGAKIMITHTYCTISTNCSRHASQPKKTIFFFIHLKSKENLSAISDDFFLKIVNNWSKWYSNLWTAKGMYYFL